MPAQAGEAEFNKSLRRNVPLAPLTTLGIGGPAAYFADASNVDSLKAAIGWARWRELPLFVLGGGSNIVVADAGFPGLVLRVALRGVATRIEADQATVTAGAGEVWEELVAACVQKNLAGFECLSGIPGLVGATPIQNVGAYGQEISETLVSVESLELSTGKLKEFRNAECGFGYRTSLFKSAAPDCFIITAVTYRLEVNGRPALRYAELERHVAQHQNGEPTLAEVRRSVLSLRKRKAMVIDPHDPDSRSVGSFFVNPVISRQDAERIKTAKLVDGGELMPVFPGADDRVKLSAAWLIERAGFPRGYVHGNVGTSTKHALAIVNRGGGTAREVLELKQMIQTRVFDVFGISINPEPVFVGFEY